MDVYFCSMCKYAMVKYKSHFVCFTCRKAFKRRLLWDINRDDKRESGAKCPQCGNLMAEMGKDFEAPKMNDTRAWAHVQRLYAVGIAFHSCGCTGPGYIPNSKEALIAYFKEHIAVAQSHLKFWRKRIAPTTSKELDREKSKISEYLYRVPAEARSKKGEINSEDAINFWIGRVRDLENKIAIASTGA